MRRVALYTRWQLPTYPYRTVSQRGRTTPVLNTPSAWCMMVVFQLCYGLKCLQQLHFWPTSYPTSNTQHPLFGKWSSTSVHTLNTSTPIGQSATQKYLMSDTQSLTIKLSSASLSVTMDRHCTTCTNPLLAMYSSLTILSLIKVWVINLNLCITLRGRWGIPLRLQVILWRGMSWQAK